MKIGEKTDVSVKGESPLSTLFIPPETKRPINIPGVSVAIISLARGERCDYHVSVPSLRASLSNQTCGVHPRPTFFHTSYDRYGNRTNVAAMGTAADGSTIPVDGLPNLTTDTATNRITASGYEYDVAGNQTKALAPAGMGVTSLKYEYDAANRLYLVKKDDGPQTQLQVFQYGSTNARLIDYDPTGTGRNTFYATVGGIVLAEYTEYAHAQQSWTKSNFYLGSRLLATNSANGTTAGYTQYHHPDRLGTKLITDGAGTTYEQAHLPFGTALNAESTITTNKERFTSYERSTPTGLDYAMNRTYDPKIGRFTQADPIGMNAATLGSPQSNNMSAYVQNMPTDFVDPSGLLRIIQCTRFGFDLGEGNIIYTDWSCRVIYDDGGGGGGGGGETTGGGGGGGAGRDNTGPQAKFDPKKYRDCLKKMFGAGPISFGNGTGGDDSALRFIGTMDGKGVTVTTRFDKGSVELGLALKYDKVGDGSPQSGATFGNFPQNNNIASEVWGNASFSNIGKLGLYIHELGNALAGIKYFNGTSSKRIGDYKGPGDHNDAGAVLENCVFGGIVGLRTGRVGTSREFRR